ncbi:ABC transporter permease [Saccharopolyspora shandongensis]|uniref:ABC transporter permease n=1 Tax=Saccharopolyspora shandongensis TaxID=418495 RepID=UPI0033CFF2A6
MFLLVLGFATLGPLVWKYRFDTYTEDNSARPSLAHPFGTDSLGYDTMALVMRGTLRSIEIALAVGLVATVVGGLLGAIAGYFGGIVDSLIMRFVDIVLVFPAIAVAAFLTRQAGPQNSSWVLVAAVLAALAWPVVARIVRSHVMVIATNDYIAATRLAGAGHGWILARHVLPNSVGVLSASVTVLTSVAILSETALSYLGFGVLPPDTSLGLLVRDAQSAVFIRPWLFYFPGLFIVIIVLSLSFIGDGLRFAFDRRGTS